MQLQSLSSGFVIAFNDFCGFKNSFNRLLEHIQHSDLPLHLAQALLVVCLICALSFSSLPTNLSAVFNQKHSF